MIHGQYDSVRASLVESTRVSAALAVVGFLLVLIASTFDFYTGIAGGTEGDLALGGVAALLGLMAGVVSINGIRREVRSVGLSFLVLASIYSASVARAPDALGVKHVVQIAFLFGVFAFFANVKVGESLSFGLHILSWLALVFMLVYVISVAHVIAEFEFARKNVLGGIIYFIALAAAITARKEPFRWLVVPLAILIGILLNERILFVLVLTLIGSYAALSIVPTRRGGYLVIALLLAAIFVFMVTYALPQPPRFYLWLDEIAKSATGRSLFSGRQNIWPLIFLKILAAPLFGYGAGATPERLLNVDLSSHNLYLQVALQVGMVGLLGLIGLLLTVWRVVVKGLRSPRVRFAGAAFLTIVVHQMSEVSLIQNQFALGILQWTVIGLTVSLGSESVDEVGVVAVK